ncbi:MAG: translation elongation factor 4, partial [Chloroflexota bacterium]
IRLMAEGQDYESLQVGIFTPKAIEIDELGVGEVGFLVANIKKISDAKIGDTITESARPAAEPFPGFKELKPMVFAGLYPVESNDYQYLREALDKLKLNDASLSFEPESSAALGFGFRCGFLGLLHMEIVQERIEREYNLDILTTSPSVEYQVTTTKGAVLTLDNPSGLPPPNEIVEIAEPWVKISVVTPTRYIGTIMELVSQRRGAFDKLEYLDENRVLLAYDLPFSEILVEFYDQLKSRTQGYASLDYTLEGYRPERLVKLELLVNGQPVDALSMITHVDRAYPRGKELTEKLRKLIPRQLFEVPIQAAIGSKVIARETIPAIRKNVLAKCYGGDVTRKRKLLEKQAEGKKRMKRVGNVEIPQEAFMAVLKLSE